VPTEPNSERPDPQRNAAVAIKGVPRTKAGQHSDPHLAGAAPRIVAKGHGAVAEQILQLAFATGVKVREDANLTEILEAIEVDTEVPLHALAAVAEILSYVYRANDAAAGPPSPKPE